MFHSISETLERCSSCFSTDVRKLLSKPQYISNKEDNKKQKTGTIVESSIEEFREDLKQQKAALESERRKDV